jgi:tetratricopeptide (TPR) repeat protein
MRPALALVLAVTLAAPARAEPPPDLMALAHKHYEAGRALYELGKFEAAVGEFEEGYRLAPRPSFLVNIAQCDRQLGRVEHARQMYEKFLAAAPIDDPMRGDVKQLLASMPPPERPAGMAAPIAPPAATVAVERPHRRWQRDALGLTLAAGGVAAVAAGAVLLGVSGYRLAHAHDNYEDYLAARGAPDQRTAGIVVLCAGVALGAGAVARFELVRRQ